MSGYTELKELENRSAEQTQMAWQQAWRGSWRAGQRTATDWAPLPGAKRHQAPRAQAADPRGEALCSGGCGGSQENRRLPCQRGE